MSACCLGAEFCFESLWTEATLEASDRWDTINMGFCEVDCEIVDWLAQLSAAMSVAIC
jgi:hypothetical protein